MVEVSATEFAKNFGRYRDAAQREPVAITSHNRVTGVLISAHDFDEYQRLRRRATQAILVEDLSDEALAAIESATMDPRHAPLDALMVDE